MKKRFLGIICLLYSGIIGYVWFSDKLKNYLAPQMQIYLKCAFFGLAIIGLVLIFSKENSYKFKLSDLILVLPLVALIAAGDGRLTASLVKNRMTALNPNRKKVVNVEKKKKTKKEEKPQATPVPTATPEPTPTPKPTATPEPTSEPAKSPTEIDYTDISNIYFKVIDKNYYDLANYMTYTDNPELFEGKTIRVKGFVTRYASFIPFGHFAIGKYGVGCCTADANFVGYIAKLDESIDLKLKNNEWYDIRGYLEKGKDNDDYDIMVIHVMDIKAIDGDKEEQYVYPCESYGSNCKEVKKYNLGYD